MSGQIFSEIDPNDIPFEFLDFSGGLSKIDRYR